jgi:hypothetical protein
MIVAGIRDLPRVECLNGGDARLADQLQPPARRGSLRMSKRRNPPYAHAEEPVRGLAVDPVAQDDAGDAGGDAGRDGGPPQSSVAAPVMDSSAGHDAEVACGECRWKSRAGLERGSEWAAAGCRDAQRDGFGGGDSVKLVADRRCQTGNERTRRRYEGGARDGRPGEDH